MLKLGKESTFMAWSTTPAAATPLRFAVLISRLWRETLRVNLEAAFVASREAYEHMRKARRGSIDGPAAP